MMPRFQVFAGTAASALLLACAEGGPPSEAPLSDAEARAIVDRLIQDWNAGVIAGDMDALTAMYTADGVRMQPDMPALVGREAIRGWMQTQADTYSFEGTNEILEVWALSPEWILFRGRGSFTATPKAVGEAQRFEEKWLTVTQRQADGTWKVYRNAGSSNLPG